MTTSLLPGFVQDISFSDDPEFFNSGTGLWHDGSGYGDFNGCLVTAGTPTFATIDGVRGWLMDNTCHARLLPAIVNGGMVITVMKPVDYDATTKALFPAVFGFASSIASNGSIQLGHASGIYNHRYTTASSVLNPTCGYSGAGNNGLKVCAMAWSQETRKSYSSKDGITITESAAVADAGSGIQFDGKLSTRNSMFARVGNISGVVDDVSLPATPHRVFAVRWRFYNQVSLITDPAAVQAEMAAIKAQYGAG